MLSSSFKHQNVDALRILSLECEIARDHNFNDVTGEFPEQKARKCA